MTDARPGGRQGLSLAVASGLGALSNFVIMFAMTRTLHDPEHQSEALAFWSVLTGLFGVLVGVQNESTRATAAVRHGREARSRLVRPVVLVAVLTAVTVAVASAVGLATLKDGWVLPSHPVGATALLVVTALAYAVYALMLGAMAGLGRWSTLAGALTAEVVVRVFAVVLVAVTVRSLLGYEAAMTSAVLVVLVILLLVPGTRRLISVSSDRDTRVSLGQVGLAMLSASATAVMITGYPALMKVALRGEPGLAAWMLAVSITRAPVMMPIITFQQVAVARFVAHRDSPLRALVAPVLLIAGVGLVASLGAGLLGPWLLRLFNPAFDINGWTLALLTLASTAMAMLVLAGTSALAMDGHRIYALGWAVASVVSVVLLFGLDGAPLPRLLTSLVAGPVAGAVVLVVWLLVQSRRSRLSTE